MIKLPAEFHLTRPTERYAVLGLMLLPFLWYFRAVFTSHCFFIDDLIAQYYPWWTYARRRLLAGEFPLWNPHVFCGMPYYVNPENHLFYPLKWLVMFLPYFEAIALLRVLNCIVAALGMFWLLRRYRAGVFAATAGAIMFTYGSFMAYEFVHLPYVSTACWLPWELLALHLLFDRPTGKRTLFLALITALGFLGGSPGIFLICQVMVGLLAVFLVSGQVYHGRWRRLAGVLLGAAAAGALVLGLVAVLLFPALEFIRMSPRQGGILQMDTYVNFSIRPTLLKLAAWPFMHWLNGAPYPPIYPMLVIFMPYLGAAAGALALCGLMVRRGEDLRPPLLLAILLGLFLAMGQYTSFFPWLFFQVEVLRWFRWPHDYLLLVYTAVALLAALGLDAIWRQWSRYAGRFTGALVVYFLAGVAVLNSQLYRYLLLAAALILFVLYHYHRRTLAAVLEHPRRRYYLMAGLGVALMADLYTFGAGYRIMKPRRDLDMDPVRPALDFIRSQAGHERVSVASIQGASHFLGQQFYFRSFPLLSTNTQWLAAELPDLREWARERGSAEWARFYWHRSLLFDRWWDIGSRACPVNLAMILGYQDLCGYDPFMLDRVNALLRARPVRDTWNLCNVRYIATPTQFADPELPMALSNTGLSVYENPARLPRAFVPLAMRSGLHPGQVYAAMAVGSFDPLRQSLLEEATGSAPALDPADIVAPPEITRYRPEEVDISVTVRRPAWLVLHDAWYPGWEAEINGRPERIRLANYAFRAVPLPAGPSHVRFVYRPRLFYRSAALSAITWLLLFVGLAWPGRRHPGRRHAD